ncbi:RsmE family RNA methyltransferase [Tautonia plasticadhaerens]|uniref:Ribosomal RNA small subunit methyltransferase E n=1 Tax=Tautonia plasticadhaerens TaxID=2527974 RepID=A0A518H878_9BACT|nr:RsmE family RNA methyltransferase [Tautonia plasticadhaerens]QDV37062.1 Ribosomal RNA small subunit methyltransferase E [Tautonia plasticadhaerens]
MERVYFPEPIPDGRAVVSGPEAHHLSRVRRARPGDPVELFDGRGRSFLARIESIGNGRVEVAIEASSPARPGPSAELTLATAVPKGDRFDWLIEKATELGVRRLVPLRTGRSVVDPRSSKLDRLRRVVIEACKQCGRDRLMELAGPISWEEFLELGPDGEGLIAHPGGVSIGRLGPIRRATLAIGPEGGFTDEEAGWAIAAGWNAIGLGPTILRVETAGLAACSAILALNEGTLE